MKGPHTIREIAQQAGVSPKTVSLVLNQKPGVKKETRQRIADIIKDVGYHPHIGARLMRGNATKAIGVLSPADPREVPISQGVHKWLLEELYPVFGSRGYYITFDMDPYAVDPKVDYARGIWEQAFVAAILSGPLREGDQTVRRLHQRQIPYVALGRLMDFPECSYATVDYEQATYLSTRYLLQRDHRRIALLKALSGYNPGLERRLGYQRALQEEDIPVDESLICPVKFTRESLEEHVYRVLSDPTVTALVDCSGFQDSQALARGAKRAGRTPGVDFEYVAWVYDPVQELFPQAAACFWLPVRKASAEGIRALSAWVEGESQGPIHILHQPELLRKDVPSGTDEIVRIFDSSE